MSDPDSPDPSAAPHEPSSVHSNAGSPQRPADSPAPEQNLAGTLLPFVPIVLALVVAFTVRHFQQANLPSKGGDGVAAATAKGRGAKLDSPAPDFSLEDAHAKEGDEKATLSILTEKSPVLVVFYINYSCPRCMGHLREIDNHLADFAQAGLQVVAISQDTPANTRDSEALYGEFHFPMLYDRDGKVSRAFGVLDDKGNPQHAAFIVDKERRTRFAAVTDHPYDDIDNLLAIGDELQKPKSK